MKVSSAALSLLAVIAVSSPAFCVDADDKNNNNNNNKNSKMATAVGSNSMLVLNGRLRGSARESEDAAGANGKTGDMPDESMLENLRDEDAIGTNNKVGGTSNESMLQNLRDEHLPSSHPSTSPSTHFPSSAPSVSTGPSISPVSQEPGPYGSEKVRRTRRTTGTVWRTTEEESHRRL